MHKIDFVVTLTAGDNDPNNVTLAFAMGKTAAEKGLKTELILLSEAVHLGSKGYIDKIDIGAPFKPAKVLLEAFQKAGGKVKICSNCMEHNGVKEEDLIEGFEIINSEYVIDALVEADKSFQFN